MSNTESVFLFSLQISSKNFLLCLGRIQQATGYSASYRLFSKLQAIQQATGYSASYKLFSKLQAIQQATSYSASYMLLPQQHSGLPVMVFCFNRTYYFQTDFNASLHYGVSRKSIQWEQKTYKTDVAVICQSSKIFRCYSTVSFTCPFLFSINNKNWQIK